MFRGIADLIIIRMSFIEAWIMERRLQMLFNTSLTFSKHTVETFAGIAVCTLASAYLTVAVFILLKTVEFSFMR
jgi:hypothetical protein